MKVIVETLPIPAGKLGEVVIEPFELGKYQVTQAQWKIVAEMPKVERDLTPDPSYFKGDTLPVEQVNSYEAIEFCARLSVHSGRKYRLPSEAEWEHACRAGTTTEYSFGDVITEEQVNYFSEDRAKNETTPVGSFPANAWGLYDMHGNVWEWTKDWDWTGNNLISSGNRILRGGSWLNNPRYCRSAYRNLNTPGSRNVIIGFRVACDLES